MTSLVNLSAIFGWICLDTLNLCSHKRHLWRTLILSRWINHLPDPWFRLLLPNNIFGTWGTQTTFYEFTQAVYISASKNLFSCDKKPIWTLWNVCWPSKILSVATDVRGVWKWLLDPDHRQICIQKGFLGSWDLPAGKNSRLFIQNLTAFVQDIDSADTVVEFTIINRALEIIKLENKSRRGSSVWYEFLPVIFVKTCQKYFQWSFLWVV